MKVPSSETFKMFFVIPRAVQSLSRYPLISCYFPKPNIKFPSWSESNKSPRRELAVLMEKKPEVKIRSGHLSLAVLAPRAPGWAWPALRRPWALCAPTGRLCRILVFWLLLLMLWCLLCLLFCSRFALTGTGVGVSVCLLFYTSESFLYKSIVTANRSIVWNSPAAALILLSYQDFVFHFSKEAFLCHMWFFCCFARLCNRDSPVLKNPVIW